MNLKSFNVKMAAVAAVVAASAIASATPAQAAAIRDGDTIDISNRPGFGVLVLGTGLTGNSPNVTALDFGSGANPGPGDGQIQVTGGTGGFAAYIGKNGFIKDLTFVGGVSGAVDDFLKISPDLFFDLTTATVTVGQRVGGFRAIDVLLSGVFTNSFNSVLGEGLLTAQLRIANVNERRSYSISAEAIPTPALLPGLAALGAMALRKRKEEAETEAEA